MATRQHKNTAQYSPLPLPLAGTEQVEVWRDGKQYQTTLDVLGGNPGPHGESHEDGTDKIGTQTPTADALVRGDDNGQVNDWVADASISVKGKVQLATDGESAASKAVQANDSRLSNSRTPSAHAASHLGGTDDLGLGTAALLNVGVADGVCGLDSLGKVGSAFLPSYVDDVVEVANFAALPVTGETGKIYVTLDDNLTYRWSGSAYVEISKSLALGETSSTAYRGDRGKTAYDHSQTAHAPSNADNTQAAIVAASSKATPVDADTLALIDSEAGSALKELPWSGVKSTLKTYFDTIYTDSVDNTSRVAEYTGDGIPLIPDNAAGTTYIWNKSGFDSWAAIGGSVSFANGVITGSSTCRGIFRGGISLGANPTVYITYRKEIGSTPGVAFYDVGEANRVNTVNLIADGQWHTITLVSSYGGGAGINYINIPGGSFSIKELYIGTGAYDTPAKDRAGNGNDLALTAVTPVNGKYGKEMSFNGSSSFAQASSPVIGTTGTVAVRFKRNVVGAYSYVFANLNASGTEGVGITFNATNVLRLVVGTSASLQQIELTPTIAETTNYHTLIFTFSSSAYYSLLDATEKTGSLTNPIDVSATNLILGGIGTEPLFAGIISHFRYDSRIWTADEARAWSLNPISVDSRV